MSSTARSTRALAILVSTALLFTGLVVGQGATRAEAQTTTTVLSETFEGAYPPSGWTIENADVTSDGVADGWDRADNCDLGFGKCLQAVGAGDRAFLPSFNTNGITNATLSFNVRIVDPGGSDASLAILDDGPSSMDGLTVNGQSVGGIYPDTSPQSNVGVGNNAVSIPLASNMSYILRFRSSRFAPGAVIQLDNIVVSGTSATPTPPPVNHIPVGIAGSATADEDIPTTVSFSAVDAGGDPLTYSIVSQPSNGTLNFTGGFASTAVYTPKKDYSGTDSFQFVAKDPSGLTSAPATVAITVNAVNDAPEVKGPSTEQTGAGQPIYFIGKNQFTVSDVDAGTSEVELRVISNAAPVSMQHKNGLTFTSGDGSEDNLIVAKGTIADINNSLNGIFWTPARNLTGKHFMTVSIDDLGNTGKGGSKITEGPVEIEIRSGPDASIGVRGKESSFKGLDLYNMDATDQTLRTDAQYTYLNRPRRIAYRVRNVGLTMETFTVSLATVGNLLEYKAFDDFGDNVTKALDNGTYEVVVPAGGFRTIDLQVNLARPPTALGETQRLTFTTRGPTPTNQPNAQPVMDVVAAEVGPVEHKPDLLISNNGQQAGAIGDNVYSDFVDGKQKVTVPAVDPGGAQSFFVWIQNDSAVPDTLTLKLEQFLPAGLRLAIYDDFSEVTNQVLNGTYELTDMAPGAIKRLRVAAVASATAKFDGVPAEVFIQAIPKDNPPGTPVDSVSADIEVAADRQPDLYIFSEQDPDRRLVGWQYTETIERRQIVREDAEPGVENWYEVFVSNDISGVKGTFNIRGRFRDAAGYDLSIFTADPRVHPDPQYDVTNQVTSGRYEVELGPNYQMRLYVRVLATDNVNPRGFPGYLAFETFAVDGLPKNRDGAAIELRAQKFQPDLQISANNVNSTRGAFVGKDVYSLNGGNQKGTVTLGGGESASYLLKIQNDGVLRGDDEIAIKSSAPANGFSVKYYKDAGYHYATDITSAVMAGTYTVKVSPGDTYASYITAVVTAPSDVAPTMDSIFVTARSVKSRYGTGGRSDVATLNTVSAYRPDLAVVGTGGLQVGQGITNRTSATQTVTIDANIGSPYKGQFVVWNAGSSPDSFKVELTGDPKTKTSLSENASGTPTLTFTTPVIAPGESAVVPFRAVLPSRTKQGTLFEYTATATSVTRPGALNDVAKLILKGKVTCSTAPITLGSASVTGECIQGTDDGWLLSKNATINGLDFMFGQNVAFLDKNAKTLSADNVTIEIANSDTKIYTGALNDMPIGRVATLNGVGTSSQVYGMAIGPGQVEIDTSKSPAVVKLPLRPLAVFSSGQPSAPITIPTSGGTGAPQNQLQITWPALRLYTLELADIKTVYDPAARRWIGYGRVGMPNLPIPKVPAFEIALSSGGGSLDFAFIKMKAGVLGVPIGTTAKITGFEAAVDARDGFSVYGKVNADLAPTPIKVPGKGEKNLPLFSVDGKFAYTNREGSKFTIQGNAKLLSFLTFGSFTATVQTDGAMRMTGNINHSIDLGFGTIGTSTTVDGAVDASGKFYLQGDGRACVVGVCVGISGVVSSKGIAACGSVKLWKTYGFGFGMHWSNASSLSVFEGCDLSNYKDAAAPEHIDFDALSKRTEDLLKDVDNVRQQIANVTSQIQNVGGPAF